MINLTYLIDDDDIVLLIGNKLLENNGHFKQVENYHNGLLALEKIAYSINNNLPLPNLILLDINMPNIDGWEFLEKLTKLSHANSIQVYMLTSSIDTADIEKSQSINIVKGYLTKPLKPSHLDQIIALLP
jgi:CheY-like chemotaxis protein